MDATVIRKQIDYLARARRQPAAADPAFEQSAQRKTKAIRQGIQDLRKLALKRRGPALICLVQEADALDEALSWALVGTVDA
jgi:hypothetical protein